MHYVGTLLDGTKFDASRDRDAPFTFKLGQGERPPGSSRRAAITGPARPAAPASVRQHTAASLLQRARDAAHPCLPRPAGRVIKGWDAGVATMKKGELAKLVCRADYAYGAAGSPPAIPPDATLEFEVELLSWVSVKDVSGDGGVIKSIVAEGKGWATPKECDEVVVSYAARLRPLPAGGPAGTKPLSAAEAGAPVVASSPEAGAVLAVGDCPCRGLAVAVKSMKVAESAVVLLTPECECRLLWQQREGLGLPVVHGASCGAASALAAADACRLCQCRRPPACLCLLLQTPLAWLTCLLAASWRWS